ncbi:MAG: aldo/keto reductase [Rhizobiales bacterium 65-79]|jgi:aryl-alcohol dehydrogenase-like predicted oxidoreductase|nr:MAG: aldo/keto reductase [Rhizobiales bacterium 65-79]
MQQRKLGAEGPLVGAIALGCMSFGGSYGETDEAESHRTLARALEFGVDHLDTSNIYGDGRAEEVIGSFIKGRPHRFRIATKGGIKRGPPSGFDNSPEYLRECLEGSLRRLGSEHVDLYYIHRRDQRIPIEDVVGTLVRFKEEGKIGSIGFSEISPASLERACQVHPVAAVQSEYSLWTRLPELGLVQATGRLGAALVAFSPLARGMLSDRMPDPVRFGDKDFRRATPRFAEPNFGYNKERVARFNAYARGKGHPPSALALAWVLARAPHIIPIPGTRSPQHLEQDAAGAGIVLTPKDMEEIEAILPVGFAHGARYSDQQNIGPEGYC